MNITEEQAFYVKKFIEEYKISLTGILNRDIPYIDKKTREDIVKYADDFLNSLIRKGYLDKYNLYERLEMFKNNTKYFGNLNTPDIYGDYGWHRIRLNFENETARKRIKHVLFHEWTHAITDKEIGELGEYRRKTTNTITNQKRGFRTTSREDNNETIINGYNFINFIHEIIAEATACDLLDDYKMQRRVAFGSRNLDITSDWITEYNTTYQQLGFEFLQTVLPNSTNKTDRELFKILTIKSMYYPYNLGQEIIDAYREKCPDTWKEDLHRITTVLGNIERTHRIPPEINEVREIMKKYNRGFRTTSRTDGKSKFDGEIQTNTGIPGFKTTSRTDEEGR